MKKSKKWLLRIVPVFLVLAVVLTTSVFGFSNFENVDTINGIDQNAGSVASVDSAVSRVWKTVTLILQILAVAAIVFAGVRYMFASANDKADIKKQTIGLVVGAILVFAASTIVNFIVNVTKDVTTGTAILVEEGSVQA